VLRFQADGEGPHMRPQASALARRLPVMMHRMCYQVVREELGSD